MLPTKFQANWPFGQEKKQRIDFKDDCHLGFPIRTTLAIFVLQVTLMFSTKFQVKWP